MTHSEQDKQHTHERDESFETDPVRQGQEEQRQDRGDDPKVIIVYVALLPDVVVQIGYNAA